MRYIKKYWTTANGEDIEYRKLGDTHLLNILRLIERKAKDGLLCQAGGGWDADEMWYDEWMEYGDDVRNRFDYKGLMKEAVRRKLIRISKKKRTCPLCHGTGKVKGNHS